VDEVPLRKPTTGIAFCYARAASGHAAAPPSSAMKSRRFISDLPTGADDQRRGEILHLWLKIRAESLLRRRSPGPNKKSAW
jgi:hypothetical protein